LQDETCNLPSLVITNSIYETVIFVNEKLDCCHPELAMPAGRQVSGSLGLFWRFDELI